MLRRILSLGGTDWLSQLKVNIGPDYNIFSWINIMTDQKVKPEKPWKKMFGSKDKQLLNKKKPVRRESSISASTAHSQSGTA